jgi:glycosyltransferase involved in cell wall biosynthesis
LATSYRNAIVKARLAADSRRQATANAPLADPGLIIMPAPVLDDYRFFVELRSGGQREGVQDTLHPKVSLVTVVLNAVDTLPRTIESVQAQSFASIEHVVVDGGSTDGTVELLRRLLRGQDYWISEPDGGISDAMNKGVALARGDYIQFIHADDWLSPRQIAQAVDMLDQSDADFTFGDLIFHESNLPSFRYIGASDYQRAIRKRMPPLNHPTVLARKACFQRIGLFDPQYRCAMDYDWFLRLHLNGGRGIYDPQIVGHMTHDGISNIAFHQTIREVQAIAIAHGRASVPAGLEAAVQHLKMEVGRWTRRHSRPLYELVRQKINRSYRSLR